jgi:hypothetical protein
MIPLSLFEAERDQPSAPRGNPNPKDDLRFNADVLYCCALCDHQVTSAAEEREVNNAFEHTLANPHGFFYTFGCFAEAPGCVREPESSTDFSWFAGYSWQIAHCAGCDCHLGWCFEAADDGFWGLILNRLEQKRRSVA